ncbi:MAG: winged helix-turn-helix domain-containing protein [Saprospiraceae bacterium]
MASSKAKLFAPLHFDQSRWSKALSHPARIVILLYLLQNGITPFYKLRKQIPLASTTVSQHLRFLRESGCIESEDIFPYTYYKINISFCKSLAAKIADLISYFLLHNPEPPVV